MADPRDGANFAPDGPPAAVVEPGDMVIAAAHLDHGHVYGQTNGLLQAGATLRWVYDPVPGRAEAFREHYEHTGVRVARSIDEVLDDADVRLVVSAAVPCERAALGLRVIDAGKDYFTDKSPFTSLDQLAVVRRRVAETGRIYAVYYGERLHNPVSFHAAELVRSGAIGEVVQVLLLAPHNLAAATRPEWFFDKPSYGGILTDIGSHQFEQFLYYTGAGGGTVDFARVANVAHPEHPGLEDFGEAAVTLDTGAAAYCRVDWLNPAASRTWGDGRAFVLGTDGYVEVRQNVDVGRPDSGPRILVVDGTEEREIEPPTDPLPFFGRLVLDCLHRTEDAMPQHHAFAAAELSMRAQALADAARTGTGRGGEPG